MCAGVATLQDLIDEAGAPATARPAASPSPPSMAAEIRALAALTEAGSSNAKELAAAKARLLDG